MDETQLFHQQTAPMDLENLQHHLNHNLYLSSVFLSQIFCLSQRQFFLRLVQHLPGRQLFVAQHVRQHLDPLHNQNYRMCVVDFQIENHLKLLIQRGHLLNSYSYVVVVLSLDLLDQTKRQLMSIDYFNLLVSLEKKMII